MPAGMMTRFFLYQGRIALAYALAALASAFGFETLGRILLGRRRVGNVNGHRLHSSR